MMIDKTKRRQKQLVEQVESTKHRGVFTVPMMVTILIVTITIIAGGVGFSVYTQDRFTATPPNFSAFHTITEDDRDIGWVTFYPDEQLMKADYHSIVIPLHGDQDTIKRARYIFLTNLKNAEHGSSVNRVMLKIEQPSELGAVLAFQRIADMDDPELLWNFFERVTTVPTDKLSDVQFLLHGLNVPSDAYRDIVEEKYQMRGLTTVRNIRKLYSRLGRKETQLLQLHDTF